jgi:hypothetical protein
MPLVAFRIPITRLVFLAVVGSSISLSAADIKSDELVAKHLDAIGSPDARKNLKTRVVQGKATYRLLAGGSGAIDGKFVFASEGQKSNLLFKINANGYLGEQFICDGNKLSVAGTYSDKSRSDFGDFILGEDIGLRENLLGGAWSAGWPLLDLEGRKAKLRVEGTKSVGGRDLLVVRYQPKRSTDLEIFMFFDPKTYQHVRTTYKASRSAGIGLDEIETARKQQTRYQIEERFSDFQTVDGLTLPTHYDLRFTEELDNGFTKSVEWEITALNILSNQSIDQRSFQPK